MKRKRTIERCGRRAVVCCVALMLLMLPGQASASGDDLRSFCSALDTYLRASAADGGGIDADVSEELQAVARTGLAAYDELPAEAQTGSLDAGAEACGLTPDHLEAPDRGALVALLTERAGADPSQAACLADGVLADFDADTVTALRYQGLPALSNDERDRYLRLVVACSTRPSASPGLSSAPSGPPAALGPDAQAVLVESNDALGHRLFNSFTGWSLADHAGPQVQLLGGVRRSYESPAVAAAADPLDVWFFGGNALFGPAQRFDHTIPSEVARLAEADGLPVRVRNYASPGFVGYQETVELTRLLSQGETPDLVVFYDGFEDTELSLGARYAGLTFAGEPSHVQAAAFGDAVDAARGRTMVANGDGLLSRVDMTVPGVDAAREAARTYAEGAGLARVLGTSYGFPVAQFWSPSIHTKALVEGERPLLATLGLAGERAVAWRALAAEVGDALPADVIDLSSALDGSAEPLLVDGSSTNEAGAHLAATALYDRLRPDLDALVASNGVTP